MPEVEGIDQRWAGFANVPAIVDEKFEDGRGYAQDAFRIAQETINKLSSLAEELEAIDVELSIDDISKPTLEDFTSPVPTAPTVELNMPDDLTQVDELENALHDKLMSDLTTGSPAISEDVETAIFNRETERSLLLHQDNLDQISAEWSKRGFTLPNGILAMLLTQAQIDYNNKRMDVSRDIAIKNFELSDANTKFAIEKALGWYALRVETYKAKVQAEIARIDAIIKKYLGEVEVYRGTAEVYKTLVDVEIKQFDAELRMALAKAELIIKDAEIDMKNYEILNNLKIEAMKAISGVSAQLVAGALSSVSAAAHLSVSNAGNYTYSTNPSY